MRSFIFSICLLASAVCAQAQVTFGPEVSLIGTNYPGKYQGQPSYAKSILSYRIGGVVDVPVCSHFSIQPALLYVRNGYKFDFTTVSATVHVNTLEVPVSVMYKIHVHGGDNIFVGLGPYFAYNMSGRYKQSDDLGNSSGPLNIGNSPTDVFKAADFGFGLNAGYQLINGLFLRIYYQRGLVNLTPDGMGGTIKNTNYGIGIGMLFGGSHAHHAKEVKK